MSYTGIGTYERDLQLQHEADLAATPTNKEEAYQEAIDWAEAMGFGEFEVDEHNGFYSVPCGWDEDGVFFYCIDFNSLVWTLRFDVDQEGAGHIISKVTWEDAVKLAESKSFRFSLAWMLARHLGLNFQHGLRMIDQIIKNTFTAFVSIEAEKKAGGITTRKARFDSLAKKGSTLMFHDEWKQGKRSFILDNISRIQFTYR